MRVKEYMCVFARAIADNDTYGYTNSYPQNQWWNGVDMDCGSFCSFVLHDALLKAGIDIGRNYYEPTGNKTPWNEAFLLKYCDRYDYYNTRNEPADILTSNGHTVMVTAIDPDYITHARNDDDGKSGDKTTHNEICTVRLYNGGWNYIYRLKDKYNLEIPEQKPIEERKVNVEVRELKKGMQGDDVKCLQALLNLWMTKDEPLYCDGVFGAITEERLKNYQTIRKSQGSAYITTVDGVCGAKTWADILAA